MFNLKTVCNRFDSNGKPINAKKASGPGKVLPGYFKAIKDPVSALNSSTSSSSETDSTSNLPANPTTALEPPLIVQNKHDTRPCAFDKQQSQRQNNSA